MSQPDMDYILSPAHEQPRRRTWPTRLWGLGVVLMASLLLACLFTYDRGQMGWSVLNPINPAEAAAVPCTNILGVFGMYVAGVLYWLLGAIAIYTMGLLIILGMGILIYPERSVIGQSIAMAFMIICASSAFSIQGVVLQQWTANTGLTTTGGMLGYLDGCCVAEPLIGSDWAIIAFIAGHGFSLIYFARFTFIEFCKAAWADCQDIVISLKDRRSARRERAAKPTDWKQEPEAPAQPEQPYQPPYRPEPQPAYQPQQQLQQQQPALPPRQKSGIMNRVFHRTPEPEPQHEEIIPDRDLEPEPAPAATRRRESVRHDPPRRAAHHHDRNNLLDLMAPVEESIALSNAPGISEAEEDPTIYLDETRRRKPAAKPAPKPAPKSTRKTTIHREQPKQTPLPLDSRQQQDDYPLPPYDLLNFKPVPPEITEAAASEMMEMQQRIMDTLETFKIPVEPGDITRGPSITRYEFFPPRGLRLNRIAALDKNLMMSTSAKSVNILAPIPGKNTVGIELENAQKSPVYLRELLQSPNFNSPKLRIPVALGKDVYGNAVIGDLAAMPHTLVAGTTGSGKSVCINSMILSMLYKFRPDELKLILVDPKVVEMQPYRKLPHLACPVVTVPGRVIGALRWAVNEMERRYKIFSEIGVRNFEDFNARDISQDPNPLDDDDNEGKVDFSAIDAMESEILRQAKEGRPLGEEEQDEFDFEEQERIPAKFPYIVIIIDELADLMATVKEDLENYIARLTQKARAAGIHLVAATQTPRANVVTGLIKANIPSRIAFRVASPLDSRIILDTTGAENLLGKGDSLFLPPGGITKMTRVQGAFVSDAEIAEIVRFCAAHAKQKFDSGVTAEMNNAEGGSSDNGGRISTKNMSDEDSELYTRCVNLVITERKASTSLLQRRFSIGYGRAAKIMDMMEENGIIGAAQGAAKAREVLVDPPMD